MLFGSLLFQDSVSLAQTSNFSEVKPLLELKNWRFTGQQVLWGTGWHSFQIDKRINQVPGAWLEGSWSGWDAWSLGGVSLGQNKLLAKLDDDLEVRGWIKLGGQIERWPEARDYLWKINSTLGVSVDSEKGTISSRWSPIVELKKGDDVFWPWMLTALMKSSAMSGGFNEGGANAVVGFVWKSDLNNSGWAIFLGKTEEKFNFLIEVSGPEFFISVKAQIRGPINKSILNKHGPIGGSTIWTFTW